GRQQGCGKGRGAEGQGTRPYGEDCAGQEALQGAGWSVHHSFRSAGRRRRSQGQTGRHAVRRLGAMIQRGGVAPALGALFLIGCGHGPPPHVAPAPPAPPTPASACLIGTSGVAATGDTLTVMVPQQDSASIASANEFDTLIRLDCEGRAIPGLASSWT